MVVFHPIDQLPGEHDPTNTRVPTPFPLLRLSNDNSTDNVLGDDPASFLDSTEVSRDMNSMGMPMDWWNNSTRRVPPARNTNKTTRRETQQPNAGDQVSCRCCPLRIC